MSDEDDRKELVAKLKAHVMQVTGKSGDDPEGWRKLFAVYDANADGLVNAPELERMLKNAGVGIRMTRATWVSRVMAALNADKDAGLSLTEVMAAVAAGRPPPATGDKSPGEPDVSLPVQSTASMRPVRAKTIEEQVSDAVNARPFWAPLLMGGLVGLLLRSLVGGSR